MLAFIEESVSLCSSCIMHPNQLAKNCTSIPAVCEVNEYVHPSSGVCAACHTGSTSAGGTPSMCTCNSGTGRVNETDVTLPCLGEHKTVLRTIHLAGCLANRVRTVLGNHLYH